MDLNSDSEDDGFSLGSFPATATFGTLGTTSQATTTVLADQLAQLSSKSLKNGKKRPIPPRFAQRLNGRLAPMRVQPQRHRGDEYEPALEFKMYPQTTPQNGETDETAVKLDFPEPADGDRMLHSGELREELADAAGQLERPEAGPAAAAADPTQYAAAPSSEPHPEPAVAAPALASTTEQEPTPKPLHYCTNHYNVNAEPIMGLSGVNGCGCGELAAHRLAGPFLRLSSYDPSLRLWQGSVLLVCQPGVSANPSLSLAVDGEKQQRVAGELLDTYGGWNFWRFAVVVEAQDEACTVSYTLSCIKSSSWAFVVPGAEAAWHWALLSNGGQLQLSQPEDSSKPAGAAKPSSMWHELWERHKEVPVHLAINAGGQLCNNDVFKTPLMQDWFLQTDLVRHQMPFSPDMEAEVNQYYFCHYCTHFSQPAVHRVYSQIPQVMTWSDMDILQGWGSYPPSLQRSQVMGGVFRVARRFYLLFQHHTTVPRAAQHGLIGTTSYNQVLNLGPRVTLMMVDCCSNYSLQEFVTKQMMGELQAGLGAAMASSEFQHLLVVLPFPMLFPPQPLNTHKLWKTPTKSTRKLIAALKTQPQYRVFSQVVLGMREEEDVSVWDDIVNRWNSNMKQRELKSLILAFQGLSSRLGSRVTMLSGHPGCCSYCRVQTADTTSDQSLELDHRAMYQVMVSGTISTPLQSDIAKHMNDLPFYDKVASQTERIPIKLNDHVAAQMLVNRRSWAEGTELPSATATAKTSIKVSLHVEAPHLIAPGSTDKACPMQTYPLLIPCYIPPAPAPQMASSMSSMSIMRTASLQTSLGITRPNLQLTPQGSLGSALGMHRPSVALTTQGSQGSQ